MAKVLIHFGFPKTGTSTLQREVFNPLHEKRKINYLGRKSFYYKELNKKEPYGFLENYWTQGITFDRSDLQLEEHKLNVFSNEEFTLPTSYFKKKVGLHPDHNSLPKLLSEIFAGDEVQIVVTLRKQPDWIYSLYVQYYSRFFLNTDEDTISEHLKLEEIENFRKEWQLAYYDTYLKNIYEHFDRKKVKVLFFEDFLQKSPDFIGYWAETLQTSVEKMKASLYQIHHRKKEKAAMGYKVEIYDSKPKQLRKTLSMIKQTLIKIPFLKSRLSKYTWKNTPIDNVVVDKLTQQEKEFIFNEFKNSNQNLVKLGLDESKLKKYGYL